MNTSGGKTGEEAVQEQLPPIGEPVWVQCDGFRCLAYLDTKGAWRTFYDDSKLSGILKVLNQP